MRIKKYVAATMPEALKLVKADLGPKAVILNTRTIRKSGGLGLLAKGQIEVTAAIDETAAARPGATPEKRSQARKPDADTAPAPEAPARPARRPAKSSTPGSRPSSRPDARPAQAAASAEGSAWADRISRQIQELQTSLSSTARPAPRTQRPLLPGALGTLAAQMEDVGLQPELADDLLNEMLLDPGEAGLKTLAPLQERAAKTLSDQMLPPAPTRVSGSVRSVVALVGPAGAGKTTAAARIAADVAGPDGPRAAFIAADTDRVGGLEQLRAYAAILSLPVDVVRSADEMVATIRSRRDVDLLLIDTAGASPSSQEEMDRLADLVKEAGPSEIHLVLGAATGLPQMLDTAKAYAAVGVDRLLLTKLDETDRLGAVCSLAARAKLPVSYTSDGRDVPGNLHPGDPGSLCRALFSRRPHVAG